MPADPRHPTDEKSVVRRRNHFGQAGAMGEGLVAKRRFEVALGFSGYGLIGSYARV
jgi:hypothetical protein